MSQRLRFWFLLGGFMLLYPAHGSRADDVPGQAGNDPLAALPVVVRLPQKGNVYAVAVSPDGRTVAGGDEITVRLWDPTTGKQRLALDGHRNSVVTVAFSPDGKLLATGSLERNIWLWDPVTGKEKRQLNGHEKGVTSLAFTSDGKLLISGGKDETIRVWEVASGKEVRRMVGHDDIVSDVAVSADGRLVASASYDRTIRLWELATGKQLQVLAQERVEVFAVAFSPDSKLLAAGSSGPVRVWDVATAKELYTLNAGKNTVYALAFSRDGKALATPNHVFELVTRQLRYNFANMHERGRAVAFSADSRSLVSGGNIALVHWMNGPPDNPQVGSALTANDWQALWRELGSDSAANGFGAMLTLGRNPRQTVPWFREHLTAASPKGRSTIAQLIEDLDSERFIVRQRASEELGKLGDLAETSLRKVLTEKPTLEVRRRIEDLLRKCENASPSPERLRLVRSVEVLEGIGTEEARKLLEVLAGGEPGALLTVEAKGALDRLRQRPAVGP